MLRLFSNVEFGRVYFNPGHTGQIVVNHESQQERNLAFVSHVGEMTDATTKHDFVLFEQIAQNRDKLGQGYVDFEKATLFAAIVHKTELSMRLNLRYGLIGWSRQFVGRSDRS